VLNVRALGLRGWLLLPPAVLLLTAVRILLPRLGYRRIEALLRPLAFTGRRPPADAEARVESSVRVVDLAVKRLPLEFTCLVRSLVLAALLRAQRVPVDLRIGVRPGGAPLDAHAWVEYGGRPINETAEVVATFTTFSR
jgi:hypothetical protein